MRHLIFFIFASVLSISAAQAQVIGPVPAVTTLPGGSSGQLQYNNAGAFGGLSTLTWDGTKFSLSAQVIDSTNGAASTPPLLLSGTWFTGGTASTTKPALLIEPTGTTSAGWSTLGTGLGVNAPFGFSGFLADFQLNGVSIFSVRFDGVVVTSGRLQSNGTGFFNTTNTGVFSIGEANDMQISRKAAASLQFGEADAAAPVAQTIGPQSVVAGTTNTAGANWTINNSFSTGSGVGGDEIHKTSASNAAATTQNAGVEILRLKASATGTNNPGRILASGQIESSGSQPTAAGAGGTCATGAIAGGANAGTVTLTGACAATNTITLTFKTASATGWVCSATDRNTPATAVQETATTTTTAVLTVAGATGATDVIQYHCTAY